ncbi:hypothetical protein A2U01_0091101 [Trifolium medium]|uniref:Uncharacterized protein n=1 Tax=Trifolium medium TaxID=97028 RepID=A0A392U9X0_9FABA|nr:hypothetical protein [Trifolium medium]
MEGNQTTTISLSLMGVQHICDDGDHVLATLRLCGDSFELQLFISGFVEIGQTNEGGRWEEGRRGQC